MPAHVCHDVVEQENERYRLEQEHYQATIDSAKKTLEELQALRRIGGHSSDSNTPHDKGKYFLPVDWFTLMYWVFTLWLIYAAFTGKL